VSIFVNGSHPAYCHHAKDGNFAEKAIVNQGERIEAGEKRIFFPQLLLLLAQDFFDGLLISFRHMNLIIAK